MLHHQPKLVGARQNVTLPRVFSEGERTALGLASFFTEAHLDASKSALILDDPVTSLDHVRRGLVAARLGRARGDSTGRRVHPRHFCCSVSLTRSSWSKDSDRQAVCSTA